MDWFVPLTLSPARAVRAELRGLYPIVASHLWDYLLADPHSALKGVYLVRRLPAWRSPGPLRSPAAAPVRLCTASNGVTGTGAKWSQRRPL